MKHYGTDGTIVVQALRDNGPQTMESLRELLAVRYGFPILVQQLAAVLDALDELERIEIELPGQYYSAARYGART